MLRFALNRLLQAIPVLLIVISATFLLVHSAPGGPFSAEKSVPPEVIKALEDFEFTGAGNGPTLYRGSDHQCIKDILVMQGKSPSARNSDFDYLQIVDQVDAKTVDYDPAIFGGELGPYEPA